MSNVAGSTPSGSILQIDEQQVRGHVDEVVRRSVEETLNGLDNVLNIAQIAFGSPCLVGIALLIPTPTKRRRLPDVECSRKPNNRKHGAD
jgi:hypothetical protein